MSAFDPKRTTQSLIALGKPPFLLGFYEPVGAVRTSHQALQQYGDQQKCKPGEQVQVAHHRLDDDQSVHSPLAGQHPLIA
jgi:hypothetical protein